MIIVNIVGGLGNQMYGYSMYRTLLERGRNVWMNLSFYEHQNHPIIPARIYQLHTLFNIRERVLGKTGWFIARAMRKLRLMPNYVERGFCPEVLNFRHAILNGYWGSFKYFTGMEEILRKEFTFKRPLPQECNDLLDEARSCNSVCLHVRRGDYVGLGWYLLPESYYRRAMRYIQERVPDAKFFCVSDDIDFCRNTLGGGGTKIH
ncbi:MAG: alpha-1,2-fucosyltransferase [Synergistaceae bacterium]|nr:alpha-1,2-fucosyltransferase [Synergistaceae bacterium]